MRRFYGCTIAEVVQRCARACYKQPVDIRCAMVNGEAIPLFQLPAGIPLDWRAEVTARVKGEWVR